MVSFLYSVSFVVISRSNGPLGDALSGLFLMLGGVLSSALLLAIYHWVRERDPAFALWALVLGLFGAAGATVHGGYDLSNALHPPQQLPGALDLPSAVDPRGLLTFGLAGLSVLVNSI